MTRKPRDPVAIIPGTALAATSELPWRSLPGLDQLLVAPLDPIGFMEILLDMLMTIPGIDAAWIGHPNDDGRLVPEVVRGLHSGVISDPAQMIDLYDGPRSLGPAGRAWHSGSAELSADVVADGGLAPWRQDWLRLGLRVGASIPLTGVKGVHRLLNLYSGEPEFFLLNWPVAVLTEFGRVIGTAIENRLNQRALLRANRLLDTLLVGVETLLDPASEASVLRDICKRLSETDLFSCAAIGQVDQDGVFGYAIAHGKAAEDVRGLRQPLDQHESQQLLGVLAWKTGVLQTVDDYASLDRLQQWRDFALRGGWQSAAAAPIRRAGALFAVLFLVSEDNAVIDGDTRRLISQLANNIGRALDEVDLKAALRAEREQQSVIARHDKLTNLPNRRAFEETLPVSLAHAGRHGMVLGLGMLDLDNFKPINDRYGHAAGDTVLRTLARRLRGALRDVDFVARLGGDEFALIIEDLNSIERLGGFCDRLAAIVRQPIELDHGELVVVEASLGFTFYPTDPEPPEMLIRHADIALYASKAAKTTRTRFWMTYQEFIGAAPAQSHYRALLQSQSVEVHFQPIITVSTGAVTAIEALARLRDGEQLLAPAAFLPDLNAEDREILFDTVLRQGIAALRHLAPIAPELLLSVNVDAEVLTRGAVLPMIEAALAGSGIAPGRLIIELLESHEFSDHGVAQERLDGLRRLGIAIAIDDLGIEFSTVQRVQKLKVDHLKLDRAFLANVMSNPNNLVSLASNITMAASLGLSLCIEGVETTDMLDALRILRAPLAQGFAIARPMPLAPLTQFLARDVTHKVGDQPRSLLGAYATHIRWVRVFLFAPDEPAVWHHLRRASTLSLTKFLHRNGLDQTPLGEAYAALMALTDQPELDITAVATASDLVRTRLCEAIMAQGSSAAAPPTLQSDRARQRSVARGLV